MKIPAAISVNNNTLFMRGCRSIAGNKHIRMKERNDKDNPHLCWHQQ
jgi:hypothetical protein